MEEFPPPPQEGYDPKLQQCVPNLGADELAVAAEAAANARRMHQDTLASAPMELPPEAAAPTPVIMAHSLPAFSELNGGDDQDQPPGPVIESEPDAFLQPPPDEQYEHQYTSTSVPVPPMMDWSSNAHHDHVHAPAPTNHINNSMDLHSPIHAPAEDTNAPPPPPDRTEHHAPPAPSGELMYTSYAIPPGPQPHHHPMHSHPGHPNAAPHAASMPPQYDPNAPQHHMYAQWPHMSYGPPQGQVAPYAAAPPTKPSYNPNHNSNFWLQEEEERFLFGLRLYGWGQWKRIQTVVQTRSNKQIKSHAQKREKVNPDIKFKYAKGKSRRGRISSKSLAHEYASTEPDPSMTLVDPNLPPMEELWKDVYGTNNGVGPNSRLRRYRSNALHLKWLQEVQDKPESEQAQQMATEKRQKSLEQNQAKQDNGSKKKLTPEGQYLYDHKVLERHSMPLQPSPGPPMPYYNHPPPHAHHYAPHPNYAMPPPPPGVSPPRTYAPGLAYHPPPPGYHHGPPVPMGHHPMPPHHGAPAVHPPPVIHRASPPPAPSPANNNNVAPPPAAHSNEEPLRPGMRVYARNKNGPEWSPGVIYSVKVDPNKAIDANTSSVPLVYHVQYDGGEEDPEVQEECILGRRKYVKALEDLEAYYDLFIRGRVKTNAPLEGGLPVYAQWMDRSNPTSHGRWLPGTVGSFQKEETPSGPIYTYHILFDNAAEKVDVSADCVLDRNEYHELVKHKHHYQQPDPSRTPIGEIYDLFSRGGDGNAGGSGQGMDLLFTASQMAAPMDTSKKRGEAEANLGRGEGETASKRVKTEGEELQQGAFTIV